MDRVVTTWLLIATLLICPLTCRAGVCAEGACCEHEPQQAVTGTRNGTTGSTIASTSSTCRGCCGCRQTAEPQETLDQGSREIPRDASPAPATPQRSAPDHDSPGNLPGQPCQCICGGAVIGDSGKVLLLEPSRLVYDVSLVALLGRTEGGRFVAQSLRLEPAFIFSGIAVRRQLCSLVC